MSKYQVTVVVKVPHVSVYKDEEYGRYDQIDKAQWYFKAIFDDIFYDWSKGAYASESDVTLHAFVTENPLERLRGWYDDGPGFSPRSPGALLWFSFEKAHEN